MKIIVYKAYIEGTDINATFELPENANIYDKRYNANEAIKRVVNIRFKKMSEYEES